MTVNVNKKNKIPLDKSRGFIIIYRFQANLDNHSHEHQYPHPDNKMSANAVHYYLFQRQMTCHHPLS